MSNDFAKPNELLLILVKYKLGKSMGWNCTHNVGVGCGLGERGWARCGCVGCPCLSRDPLIIGRGMGCRSALITV